MVMGVFNELADTCCEDDTPFLLLETMVCIERTGIPSCLLVLSFDLDYHLYLLCDVTSSEQSSEGKHSGLRFSAII